MCIPRVTGRMARQPAPMPFGQGRRMLNLSALCVDRHLGDHADRAAITGPEIVSYRSLHERVCRLANALNDQGVRRGDTVAVTLPPGVDGIVAVLACMRIGAVHVLLAGGLDAPAMAAGLSECCAVAVIAGGDAQAQSPDQNQGSGQGEHRGHGGHGHHGGRHGGHGGNGGQNGQGGENRNGGPGENGDRGGENRGDRNNGPGDRGGDSQNGNRGEHDGGRGGDHNGGWNQNIGNIL